jgi:hypothetical protein
MNKFYIPVLLFKNSFYLFIKSIFCLIITLIISNATDAQEFSDTNLRENNTTNSNNCSSNKIYSGTVLHSESLLPIDSALIIVPGTNLGTITNNEGLFIIQVPNKTKKLIIYHKTYESEVVDLKMDSLHILLIPKQ